MSLLAASFMWFVNLFHTLGADARKDLSRYIAVWFLSILKSEYDSDRGILTGIYVSIRSLRYTGAVPFHYYITYYLYIAFWVAPTSNGALVNIYYYHYYY